jgi:hypothetical protein
MSSRFVLLFSMIFHPALRFCCVVPIDHQKFLTALLT